MSLHNPTAFNNQTCLNIAHPAVYKTVQRGCQIKQLFAKIRTAISKIPTFQTTNERKLLESTNDLFIQCSRSMTNFGSFEMFPISQNIFNNRTPHLQPSWDRVTKNADNQRSSN